MPNLRRITIGDSPMDESADDRRARAGGLMAARASRVMTASAPSISLPLRKLLRAAPVRAVRLMPCVPVIRRAASRPRAVAAAGRTRRLVARARAARVPVIYANDNFGRWQSHFNGVVDACRAGNRFSRTLALALAPQPRDYSVLKPRHSAFFETPLHFLLDRLRVRSLVITGIATDSCILATAIAASMRKYSISVPSDCVAAQTAARQRDALAAIRHFDPRTTIAPAR
jgi:nicotinamidase-related amidase